MKPEEYKKMMKEHGYHGLQLVHMSLEEAKKFAGEYGMNAIVYNFAITSMTLCRLENTPEGLVGTYNGGYGPRTFIVEPKIHDIYWIGGDDPNYDSYEKQVIDNEENNEETVKWIGTKDGRLIDLQDYNLDEANDEYYYFSDKKTGSAGIKVKKSDVDAVYTKFNPNMLCDYK